MPDDNFARIPNSLVRDSRIPIHERALWMLLRSYQGTSDDCYPSQYTLARDMRTTRDQIRKYLTGLEDRGLITIIRHRNGEGHHYQVHNPTGTDTRPAPERKPMHGPDRKTRRKEDIIEEDTKKKINRRPRLPGSGKHAGSEVWSVRGEAPKEPRPASQRLSILIGDLSNQLHDEAHAIANVTQAHNIWWASKMPEHDFCTAAQDAYRKTQKARHGQIDKLMPYFFQVLRTDTLSGAQDRPN